MKYFLRLAVLFAALYLLCEADIALSSPGGAYSAFVDRYLDFISVLRASILGMARFLLEVAGHTMQQPDAYRLRFAGGSGIVMVYSCIGYGVLSFWIAFVWADVTRAPAARLRWMLAGALIIWFSNVLRIIGILIALKGHSMHMLPVDHHTLYNMLLYAVVLWMMWRYSRQPLPQKEEPGIRVLHNPGTRLREE